MVAALCYAWLLENRGRNKKVEGEVKEYVVVPVMNVRRRKMSKYRQAAWLFHHVGLDATSLLFADEVTAQLPLIHASLFSIFVSKRNITIFAAWEYMLTFGNERLSGTNGNFPFAGEMLRRPQDIQTFLLHDRSQLIRY